MRTIHWPDVALLLLAFGVLCFATAPSAATAHACGVYSFAKAGKFPMLASQGASACAQAPLRTALR